MNKNLLIVGAGMYAVVAFEIAADMGTFDKIDFVDDNAKTTPNGIEVIGTTDDIENLSFSYGNIIVAIGNPEVRLPLIEQIRKNTSYRIATLISPKAHVSISAEIGEGCIIEPMAVVHTASVLGTGCIVSAGAVINHASTCCDAVHVDCGAIVAGYSFVPSKTKIQSGDVYKNVK